jgi:exonuclease III
MAVSWNIAGYKSVLTKGFVDYVKNENADVYCIQETKIDPSQVKGNFTVL